MRTGNAAAASGQVVVAVEHVDEGAEDALDLGEVLVVAELNQERQQPQHLRAHDSTVSEVKSKSKSSLHVVLVCSHYVQ